MNFREYLTEESINKDRLEAGELFHAFKKEVLKDKEDMGKGVKLIDLYSTLNNIQKPDKMYGKDFSQIEDYYIMTLKDDGVIKKFNLEMSDMKSIKAKAVQKSNDIMNKIKGKYTVNKASVDGTVNRIDFGLSNTQWKDAHGYNLDLHIKYSFNFPKNWNIKDWKNA